MSQPKWVVPAGAAIAAFFLIALVISQRGGVDDGSKKHKHHSRRLGSTRLGDDGHIDPKYERKGFDPEAAMHEPGHEEDDEWESYHDHHHDVGEGDHGDYDYWDNGNFNITDRLHEIFPQIDQDGDGRITVVEMQVWHLANGLNSSMERAASEHETSDADGDGLLSLKEYLADDYGEGEEEGEGASDEGDEGDNYNRDWVRSTKISFALADENGDGHLNVSEYFVFLHPEESSNSKLHAHLRDEDIRDRDENDDGKLSFEEFESGLWYALSDPDYQQTHEEGEEEGSDGGDDWEAKDKKRAKEKFDKLDADKDGHLVADELLPVMEELHPKEAVYSQQQAEHMMEQADADEDKHLTLSEMVENPYVFYSAAYGEDHGDYSYHDEFR